MKSSPVDIVTSIPEVPVTFDRPIPSDLDQYIPNPGLPRAFQAPSKEQPYGSAESVTNLSVLQQHAAFWDRDNDGRIYPADTYIGFRELGYNLIISILAVIFLHSAVPYITQDGWILDWRMIIYLKNLHRIKHGSDSETYDEEGRFVPQKFEELFTKFDREGKAGLGYEDLQQLVAANKHLVDPIGWVSARLEWLLLWWLTADEEGIVAKEDVRSCYDGTLFYRVAERVQRKKWEY